MASQLHNFTYALKWSDFKGRIPPGKSDRDAETTVKWKATGLKVVRHSSGKGVTLKDSITTTINLVRKKCWVRKGKETAALLNHEQGHYNMNALLARDELVELWQLRLQSFKTTTALQAEVTRILTAHSPTPIRNKYDSKAETHHGLNAKAQARWDGYFKKAMTVNRSPVAKGPDGNPLKLRFLDVLKASGHRP